MAKILGKIKTVSFINKFVEYPRHHHQQHRQVLAIERIVHKIFAHNIKRLGYTLHLDWTERITFHRKKRELFSAKYIFVESLSMHNLHSSSRSQSYWVDHPQFYRPTNLYNLSPEPCYSFHQYAKYSTFIVAIQLC